MAEIIVDCDYECPTCQRLDCVGKPMKKTSKLWVMGKKKCTKCNEVKNEDEFYWRSSGWTRYSHCKQCHKEMVCKT